MKILKMGFLNQTSMWWKMKGVDKFGHIKKCKHHLGNLMHTVRYRKKQLEECIYKQSPFSA